ncbi:hypothetical protein Pfo_030263 [Paulownia fortunei]|nr:hypothetical protein Pfo_030263 [Paulownia fortunei]
MASWNSAHLQVLYNVLGWIAFVCWSFSFYPQVILNFRRKSVVGFNFDFALANLTKQLAYLIYNASLFFSSTVQKQYHKKFGYDEMLPVAPSDLAFSIHAVVLSAFTLFQIAIYDRGSQRFSKTYICIVFLSCLAAAVCVFVAIPRHSWFWLVSCFNTIQVVMTFIKYIPQAIFNFHRKSTSGFSIGNILLDFLGGVANNIQMAAQSIDQHSWENWYGNLGKTMLALVTIFFDILFMVQHYVLYPSKKTAISSNPSVVSRSHYLKPLIICILQWIVNDVAPNKFCAHYLVYNCTTIVIYTLFSVRRKYYTVDRVKEGMSVRMHFSASCHAEKFD